MGKVVVNIANNDIFAISSNPDTVFLAINPLDFRPNINNDPLWVTSHVYSVGDVVFYNNVVYVSKLPATGDESLIYVNTTTGQKFDWNGTSYIASVNPQFTNIYICKTAHTSSDFISDISKWDIHVDNTVISLKSISQAEKLGITKLSSGFEKLYNDIVEYFAVAVSGVNFNLYIPSTPSTIEELATLIYDVQYQSNGIYKVIFVKDNAFQMSESNIGILETKMEKLVSEYFNADLVYAPKFDSVSTINDEILNLTTLQKDSPRVRLFIGQGGITDNGGKLSSTNNAAMGLYLGELTKCRVNQNVGQTQPSFDISTYINKPCLTNGIAISSLSTEQKNILDSYHYIYFTKYPAQPGTYINDDRGCTADESSFRSQWLVRTMDKAFKLTYDALFPYINYEFLGGDNGTLSNSSIAFLKSVVTSSLSTMVRNQEITSFDVFIDPKQIVAPTSTVYVTITVKPTVNVSVINATIGYTI